MLEGGSKTGHDPFIEWQSLESGRFFHPQVVRKNQNGKGGVGFRV